MLKKSEIIQYFNQVAPNRQRFRTRHQYFYKLVENYLKFYVPKESKVLVIGCGTGELLQALEITHGVGIDISEEMITIAKEKFPQFEFYCMDGEQPTLTGTFDIIIFSDVIGYFEDIQMAFEKIRPLCTSETRIMITYYNALWRGALQVAEKLKLKMSEPVIAWLAPNDIQNLLELSGFEVIRKNLKIMLPINIPFISGFFNYFIANLPFFRKLCLQEIVSARIKRDSQNEASVSVIIPTRNEKGNIRSALERVPMMGKHTEIIFVDGHSTDGTLEEIQSQKVNFNNLDIKIFSQEGKGKGDAVRKGFANACGDILMILDADLTVPPEELPKFYAAIVTGKGEFINGTRLVYPMEEKAMRFLNLLGNKFFSMVFTYLLEQRFKDTLCGTKVISKTNYLKLAANRNYFGDFDPFGDFDLLFGAAKLNLKIVEIPIRYRERTYGETNISRFRHGWILLKMCVYAFKKIKMV